MSLSRPQIESLWVREGGNPRAARTAAAVALAESSGNPSALNHNTNGSIDRGLFQINSVHGRQSTTDLRANVRAAIAISNGGRDWAPWVTYKTGAYKRYVGAGGGAGASTPPRGAGGPQTPSGGQDAATLAQIGQLEAELRHSTVPVQGPQLPLPRLLQGATIAQGVAPERQDTQLLGAVEALRAGLGGGGAAPAQGGGARVPRDARAKANGPVMFDGHPVAPWIAEVLHYVASKGVKPEIESGYRSRQKQQEIWDSGVRPAARPGHSKHELLDFPGGAVDIRNAQAVARVIERSPYRGRLVWAGAKDPVHFSHPVNGTY